MRILLFISFLLSGTYVYADTGITLHFVAQYNHEPLILEYHYYPSPAGDSIAFDVLKYYIGNVSLYNGGKLVFAEQGSYHLIDHSDESTTTISVKTSDAEPWSILTFSLGVDSTTNVSGALGGDLDPGKGMYWAWQSGYINFKLEGRSNACPTRKNEFAFHLGGYMTPGYAMQIVNLPVQNKEEITVYINLDRFVQSLDLSQTNSVMIPGAKAVEIARKAAETFQTEQP